MGVSGLIMVGFLIGHMLGNLLVYLGAERLNSYARFLHGLGELLWLIRGVLLASLVLHVVAAAQLTLRDRAARPVRYEKVDRRATTVAARTMRWGGGLLAAFIAFHLLHFTFGTVRPAPFSAGDVYANVTGSFLVPWVAALYVGAMIVVGLHVYHGAWSAVRSLGVAPGSEHPLRNRVALAVAGALWLGFTAVPVGVFLHWVR